MFRVDSEGEGRGDRLKCGSLGGSRIFCTVEVVLPQFLYDSI